MEAVDKTLEGLCNAVDKEQTIEKKAEYVTLLKEVADVYVQVTEAEKQLIEANQRTQIELAKLEKASEDRKRQNDLEERKLEMESKVHEDQKALEEKKLEVEEKRVDKDAIVRTATGFAAAVGGVSTIALGVMGLRQKADIYNGIMSLEGLDKLPISKSFDLFSKKEM